MPNYELFRTFAPEKEEYYMKIGDKVRFLNEVGGGVISGFQDKNIVLVEDADGFQVPMLRSQVVVIETNANNFEIKKQKGEQKPAAVADESEDSSASAVTYTPRAQERKGGDLLNICLAFVPENSRDWDGTRFEGYLVNDSNYYTCVVLSSFNDNAWSLCWQGIIEPNTKQLFDIFDRLSLNKLERLQIQLVTWKQDKPFALKHTYDVALRLNLQKFYKLHAFHASPFFKEPSLVFDIVHDDASEHLPIQDTDDPMEDSDSAEILDMVEPQPRSRAEEREALRAAKRALKEEKRKQLEQERTHQAEQLQPLSRLGKSSGKDDILEIDLHINALLDHTEGLSRNVLMNTQLTEFRIVMDRYQRKPGQRIVFIYGRGEELLRENIIKELQRRYRSCVYEDASLQKYGYGATLVTIR